MIGRIRIIIRRILRIRIIIISKQRRLRSWRCTSKRQRTGENIEVPISSRRNREFVEA